MTAAEMSYDPPRPIGRWYVEATCPNCGGILGHLADGRPSTQEARAVARCTDCDRVWKAQVTLLEVTRDVGTRPRHRAGCGCRPCGRRNAA